jgi:predicted flap endonuclease-1-like 5' DNA nuclease
LDGCLAALHASHNLGVDFNCLRAGITGVHSNSDMSGCKVGEAEKSQSLNKAIHQLKPEANAKQAAKDAEQQAKDDLKSIAG